MDLLVFANVGGVQQVFIDGTGAFIVQLALNNKELNWFEFMVDNRFFYKLSVRFFNKVAQSVLCDKFRVQSTTFCQNFIVQKMVAGAQGDGMTLARSSDLVKK